MIHLPGALQAYPAKAGDAKPPVLRETYDSGVATLSDVHADARHTLAVPEQIE